MAARNLPCSGEPLLIEHLLHRYAVDSAKLDGQSVRVVGRLEEHNIHKCTAVLVDSLSKKQLVVNTGLVEPFNAKIGSLFQFIGELDCQTTPDNLDLTLKARVVRCVDGLDIKMYQQALEVQRQYLASRKRDLRS